MSGDEWICGYCLTPVSAGQAWTQCSACQRVIHEECWAENKGCVTLGCSQHPSSYDDGEAAGSTVLLTDLEAES